MKIRLQCRDDCQQTTCTCSSLPFSLPCLYSTGLCSKHPLTRRAAIQHHSTRQKNTLTSLLSIYSILCARLHPIHLFYVKIMGSSVSEQTLFMSLSIAYSPPAIDNKGKNACSSDSQQTSYLSLSFAYTLCSLQTCLYHLHLL